MKPLTSVSTIRTVVQPTGQNCTIEINTTGSTDILKNDILSKLSDKLKMCCELAIINKPPRVCDLGLLIDLKTAHLQGVNKINILNKESEPNFKMKNTASEENELRSLKQCQEKKKKLVFRKCCVNPDLR